MPSPTSLVFFLFFSVFFFFFFVIVQAPSATELYLEASAAREVSLIETPRWPSTPIPTARAFPNSSDFSQTLDIES